MRKILSFFLIWAGLRALGVGVCEAQEVVAVLSSKLPPYVEAYEGFLEAFGRSVPVMLLDENPRIDRQTRVLVAFGGKAALVKAPEGATLIYCMAPGTLLESDDRRRPPVKVMMLPRTELVVAKLREIQPGLGRLGVLWASETMDDSALEMQQVCRKFGIRPEAKRVSGAEALPDLLRELLYEGVDALWLMPDPFLITGRNFVALKAFCWANDIPLFVPTSGLVEKGAVGSVASRFREIGRVAGRLAAQALAGAPAAQEVYPEDVEVTLNLVAAVESNLSIPDAVRRRADRVLP